MEPWLHTIANLFYLSSAPVYLVGGAVRNMVLNLPIEDYDLCGPLSPQEVEALCAGSQVMPIGIISSFGTLGLKVVDDFGSHVAEYTTFRRDEYQGGHRPSRVQFITSLKEDSLRRDFSINALYQPLLPSGLGPICDPTGGLDALAHKRLHTVTLDPYPILKDDGLRILRLVRFACDFDLTPSPLLMETARSQAPLLKDIAPERICQEFEKILLSDIRYPKPKRSNPIQKAFSLIKRLALFSYILPFSAVSAQGISACASYRPDSKNLFAYRLSLLLFDQPADAIKKNLLFLRLPKKTSLLVLQSALAIRNFLNATDEELSQKGTLWLGVQAGKEIFLALPGLLRALGNEPRAQKIEGWLSRVRESSFPWNHSQLAINGNDLLPLVQGKEPSLTGLLLKTLHQLVVLGQVDNSLYPLLEKAKELIPSLCCS